MGYIVIKCGGSVIEEVAPSFYSELCNLLTTEKYHPIVVHGGGKVITSLLAQLKVPSVFIDGLRVTTDSMLDVVEMALCGHVNKLIVRNILQAGGQAVGISGVDGRLFMAAQINPELGYTGYIKSINKKLLLELCNQKYIPVVSPFGIDKEGQRYNINADTAASAIASELQCPLLLVSDIPGIYKEVDGKKQIIPLLSTKEVDELIENEGIKGGMIPKVNAAKQALFKGVQEVVILDGREENIITSYCNNESPGTKLYKKTL